MSRERDRGPTPERVGRTVRKEIRIDASPQAVWEAWANPEKIARWFVDRAEGEMEAGATVTWVFEQFDYRLPVEVYEAVPGERLAFGGEAPGRPTALQEVTVRREGGSTVLRLVNSGFLEGDDWDEEMEGVDSGWEMALATLKHWLENHRAGRRDHRLLVRSAGAFAYDDVRQLYTTRHGLESWLAASAELPDGPLVAGARCTLELEALDGGGSAPALEGRVLAASDRELLLSWPAIDGVLGLKAFRFGEGRAVALDLNAWPLPAAEGAKVETALSAAVDRLAARVA